MAVQSTPRRRQNGHDHDPDANLGACPLCGAPLSAATAARVREIEAREKSRIAALETSLKSRFEKEQQQIAAKTQAELARAKRESAAQVEKARREATAAATASLELKIAEAIGQERQRHQADRQKLIEQLADLKSKVDRQDRPATSLGREGELDAMSQLVEAFAKPYPADKFERVGPGKAGGDIVHKVVAASGEVIASLLYEIKNVRGSYQTKWPVKARADQLAGSHSHVVIVTSVFPSGKSDLMVEQNGVLVCSFERLVAVAMWLRLFCARSHSMKLAGQNRLDKADRLYRFMTSDRVQDRWDRMTQTMTRMKDALRLERTQHEKLWSDRTDQIDVLHTIRESFVTDLDAIFESTDVEAAS